MRPRRRTVLITDLDAAGRKKVTRELEREFSVLEVATLPDAEPLLRDNRQIVAMVSDGRSSQTPEGQRLLGWLASKEWAPARIWISPGRRWPAGAVLQAVQACVRRRI